MVFGVFGLLLIPPIGVMAVLVCHRFFFPGAWTAWVIAGYAGVFLATAVITGVMVYYLRWWLLLATLGYAAWLVFGPDGFF